MSSVTDNTGTESASPKGLERLKLANRTRNDVRILESVRATLVSEAAHPSPQSMVDVEHLLVADLEFDGSIERSCWRTRLQLFDRETHPGQVTVLVTPGTNPDQLMRVLSAAVFSYRDQFEKLHAAAEQQAEWAVSPPHDPFDDGIPF